MEFTDLVYLKSEIRNPAKSSVQRTVRDSLINPIFGIFFTIKVCHLFVWKHHDIIRVFKYWFATLITYHKLLQAARKWRLFPLPEKRNRAMTSESSAVRLSSHRSPSITDNEINFSFILFVAVRLYEFPIWRGNRGCWEGCGHDRKWSNFIMPLHLKKLPLPANVVILRSRVHRRAVKMALQKLAVSRLFIRIITTLHFKDQKRI